jgi:hypothetical protein
VVLARRPPWTQNSAEGGRTCKASSRQTLTVCPHNGARSTSEVHCTCCSHVEHSLEPTVAVIEQPAHHLTNLQSSPGQSSRARIGTRVMQKMRVTVSARTAIFHELARGRDTSAWSSGVLSTGNLPRDCFALPLGNTLEGRAAPPHASSFTAPRMTTTATGCIP